MKTIVKEQTVKFIECGGCGYERSFYLNPDVEFRKFDWDCPKCGRHWGGVISDDGTIETAELEQREKRYVLVELDTRLTPFCMIVSANEALAKISSDSDARSAQNSETLYLEQAAPDHENNPQGFAQFRAQAF